MDVICATGANAQATAFMDDKLTCIPCETAAGV